MPASLLYNTTASLFSTTILFHYCLAYYVRLQNSHHFSYKHSYCSALLIQIVNHHYFLFLKSIFDIFIKMFVMYLNWTWNGSNQPLLGDSLSPLNTGPLILCQHAVGIHGWTRLGSPVLALGAPGLGLGSVVLLGSYTQGQIGYLGN